MKVITFKMNYKDLTTGLLAVKYMRMSLYYDTYKTYKKYKLKSVTYRHKNLQNFSKFDTLRKTIDIYHMKLSILNAS